MNLLIDGYNLLHVTGIFGKGSGPGMFQRSREAFLRFLATSLDDDQRCRTTIIFDAADAPPGLPSTLEHSGMVVRYARGYPDADSLIEELIQRESVPRKLLVVSSDHRIQRAARKRKAHSIDSDAWYSQLWQRPSISRQSLGKKMPEKPVGELSSKEVEYWINEFTTEDLEREDPADSIRAKSKRRENAPDNPFPPGYGEDLLESE